MKYLYFVGLLFLFGFDIQRHTVPKSPKIPDLPTFAVHRNIYFDANTPDGILKTGIVVNKYDFVCFEASDEIKLGSTVLMSDARGALAPHLASIFNRIEDQSTHGRLFCSNVDEWVPTRNLESMKSGTVYISNHCGTGEIDFGRINTNAFVAKDKTELLFMLNDSKPENNTGRFCIQVVIVPYEVHRTRNRFNKCPKIEPKMSQEVVNECFFNSYKSVDYKNFNWMTTRNEEKFHGGNNNTYRASDQGLVGCQCTYTKDTGELVEDHFMGTFDFAYAKRGRDEKTSKDVTAWKHIVLDVWPHIAFKKFAEATGRRFAYEPMPAENIY